MSFDAFGDLGFSKKPEKMTLAERQRQSESTKQQHQTQQRQQWSGLDSLGSLGSSLSASAASAAGASKTTNTLNRSAPASASTAPATTASLLDDFDVFTSAPPVNAPVSVPAADPFADFEPVRSQAPASGAGAGAGAGAPPRAGAGAPPSRSAAVPAPAPASQSQSQSRDHAIAQLVDMGFSDVDAGRGLDAMGSVKGAINYLMAEAQGKPHPKPKQKANQEDVMAKAQDMGAQVFATASSWWSKGRKQLQKTIDTYQGQPSSDGQPAWMRSQGRHIERESRLGETPPPEPRTELPPRQRTFNEELPMRRRDPPASAASASAAGSTPAAPKSRADLFREKQAQRSAGAAAPAATPATVDTPSARTPADPFGAAGASFAGSGGSARASPAPAPAPAAPEIDLLGMSSAAAPALSSTQADMMETSRTSGTEAFKRGDYAGSITYFTSALQSIPSGHMLRTILLSNRSAALLKEGDSHAALADTTEGLKIIGQKVVRKDSPEEIEPGKSLVDIWVKLQVRRAQAYEHLEKHPEALEAWRLLLDNGHSNTTYLDGKRRCQAAIDQKNKPATAAAPPVKKSARRGWGTTGAAPTSAQGKAAVDKVRQLNEQQEKSDRERSNLLESVTLRIDKWKQGKETDLRALLSTLQDILWKDSNWTPVSSADLVSPKKARIVYMKAVAKTHPDKISSTAPTEVKMISETVFITLNKAWETFKDANGLK